MRHRTPSYRVTARRKFGPGLGERQEGRSARQCRHLNFQPDDEMLFRCSELHGDAYGRHLMRKRGFGDVSALVAEYCSLATRSFS